MGMTLKLILQKIGKENPGLELDSKVAFCNLMTNALKKQRECHEQLNMHQIFWRNDVPKVTQKWLYPHCETPDDVPATLPTYKRYTANIMWVRHLKLLLYTLQICTAFML
jgi:hypothetical protein